MEPADSFTTEVVASDGFWPDQPTWMSYSSLADIEQCPRRWMLTRATYPDLWGRSGYPDMPSLPSVYGQIIHTSLEVVINSMAAHGCAGPNTDCATAALRSLGGYTALITHVADEIFKDMAELPATATGQAEDLRLSVDVSMADIRQRVQALVEIPTHI